MEIPRVEVLNLGFVELQDVMGNDLAIVNAARVSVLGESKGNESDKKLLNYLMSHRHTSPFEQVQFKFRVKAPLVTWWQWMRHRTWSFNMQSGRYLAFDEEQFYIPSEWRLQAKSNKQGSDGILNEFSSSELDDMYRETISSGFKAYEYALSLGVAREEARLFLPGFAMYYTGVASVNAHNLMHFLRLRMTQEAQYEIRVYAEAVHSIFEKVLPWTAEAFNGKP